MKTLAFVLLTFFAVNSAAQESAFVISKSSASFIVNGAIGIGTFAAGENMGGSVFIGTSLSADWIPN